MSLKLTRQDILPLPDYEKIRLAKREEILALKKRRRLFVGPYANFLFENKATLWWQIQEMLRIEQGGEEQIVEELLAYGSLVPQGSEWIATLMFEIEDPTQRAKILANLGHVEQQIVLHLGSDRLQAMPTEAEDRTDQSGKTSAVHFLRFPFIPAQKAALLSDNPPAVTLEIAHLAYPYSVTMPSAFLAELKKDLEGSLNAFLF